MPYRSPYGYVDAGLLGNEAIPIQIPSVLTEFRHAARVSINPIGDQHVRA